MTTSISNTNVSTSASSSLRAGSKEIETYDHNNHDHSIKKGGGGHFYYLAYESFLTQNFPY